MSKNEQTVGKWIGVVASLLIILAYAVSSATKVEEINSRSLNNGKKIDKVDQRNEARFIRMENKLDLILQKVR